MKYLNRYKIFEKITDNSALWDRAYDLTKAKNYINFLTNFPELENIKMILQNLSDWCFINTKPVKFWTQLYRNKQNKIRSMPISIIWDIESGYIDYKDEIYYKSYCIDVPLPAFNHYRGIRMPTDTMEKTNNIFKQIELAEKRLKNYGLDISINDGDEFTIYMIDKNSPITMQEIINKYESSK